MIELGCLLRQAREDRGLSVGDVANAMGYSSARKGERRVRVIESTGVVTLGRLVRLAEVLELDWAALEEVVSCLRVIHEGPPPATA
jgi:transcriptional regulator with XRE-family HTH domain